MRDGKGYASVAGEDGRCRIADIGCKEGKQKRDMERGIFPSGMILIFPSGMGGKEVDRPVRGQRTENREEKTRRDTGALS